MKRIFVYIAIFFSFLISACDLEYVNYYSENFAYELRGTWISNDPSIYSGTLRIDSSRITITGHNESQTPSRGDDNKRPFRGFIKGVGLKGYSQEGRIFIENVGVLHAIPYVYWEGYYSADYRQTGLLSFNFGGRTETLQKIN